MKIFERVASLRSSLGLSRERFAQLIDVSVNTLRAIETKGVTPKSDILEKIARQYPQVAAWLLIEDKVEEVEQESLESFYSKKELLKVVALADASFMDKLPINSAWMENLILIQAIDDETTLSGLIKLCKWPSPTDHPENVYVMIRRGNLNLFSDHGGKLALDNFKAWLKKNNEHLLASCTIQFAHDETIGKGIESGKFEGTIPHVALPHDDLVIEAKKRFETWKHD